MGRSGDTVFIYADPYAGDRGAGSDRFRTGLQEKLAGVSGGESGDTGNTVGDAGASAGAGGIWDAAVFPALPYTSGAGDRGH